MGSKSSFASWSSSSSSSTTSAKLHFRKSDKLGDFANLAENSRSKVSNFANSAAKNANDSQKAVEADTSLAGYCQCVVINCKLHNGSQRKCESSCTGVSELGTKCRQYLQHMANSSGITWRRRSRARTSRTTAAAGSTGHGEMPMVDRITSNGSQIRTTRVPAPVPAGQNSSRHRLLNLFALVVLVVICLLQHTPAASAQSLIVSTENGRIRGILGTSRDGRSYSSFLGIPYAKPPLRELRFEPPQPAGRWPGILSTTQYGPECLQMDVIVTGRLSGDEDCLYLNVFTPWIMQRGQRRLLPVLVFIHGGFFMSGSSNMFRGKYFMDHDVVLVTLNYRLGAFGFLNVGGESNIKGNMGMKDQTMALKWIQRNIHKFGGDPRQVTLFGESVGGASVQYHMISPLSQDLFQKGISQSGTAARNYMLTQDSAGQANYLAKRLGCPTQNLKWMGDCMRAANAQDIVHVHREAITPEREQFAFYGPTIEQDPVGAFFTEDPRILYRSGNFTKMPWISGVDSGEGLFYVAQILREGRMLSEVENSWDQYLPRLLNYNGTKHPAAAQKIRQYYFGQSPTLRLRKNLQNFTNMFSDRMFFLPQKEGSLVSSQYAPTFMYYFSYETPISIFDLIMGMNPNGIIQEIELAAYMTRKWLQQNVFGPKQKFLGASHGDELSILFDTHLLSEIRRGTTHYRFSKEMVKLWSDFARDENSMKFFGTKWPPIAPNDPSPIYMELNNKGRLIYEPFKERMDFWSSLNLGDYLYS